MRLSLLFVCLLVSFYANSTSFNIVTGVDRPPYSMQRGKTGFEIDLLSAVLDNVVEKHEFVIAPYGRSLKILDVKSIDAMTTASIALYNASGKVSEPYIKYQNIAVTLKADNFKIKTLSELEHYSIATFLNAKTILGKNFEQVVEKSNHYIELSDQSQQLHMLRRGKVKVLVMDINIFNYFNKFHELEVDIHKIFPLTTYGLLVKDEAIKRSFNLELNQFIKSKDYIELADKWSIDPGLLID